MFIERRPAEGSAVRGNEGNSSRNSSSSWRLAVGSGLSDDVIHQQMPFSLLLRQGSLSYNAPCQPVQIGAMWSPPALAPAWTKERPQLKWPELRLAYK